MPAVILDGMTTVPTLPDLERRTTYAPVGSAGPFDVDFDIWGDGTDYDAWVRVFLDGLELLPGVDWTMDSPTGTFSTMARPITDARVTLTSPRTGDLAIFGQMRPRRTSQLTEGRGVSANDFNLLATRLMASNRETYDRLGRLEDQVATQIADPTIAPNAVRVDVVQTFTDEQQSRALANLRAGDAVWLGLHTFAQTISTDGDLRLGRTDQGFGYISRPDVVGKRNIAFAVDGGGQLDSILMLAQAVNLPGALNIGEPENVRAQPLLSVSTSGTNSTDAAMSSVRFVLNEHFPSFDPNGSHKEYFTILGGKNDPSAGAATSGSHDLFAAAYFGAGGTYADFFTASTFVMSPFYGWDSVPAYNTHGRFFATGGYTFIRSGLSAEEATTAEFDLTTLSDISGDRHGVRIVDINSTGNNPTAATGLSIVNAGGIGWNHAIYFGDLIADGRLPVKTGGTLIGATAGNALYGIDFSAVSFDAGGGPVRLDRNQYIRSRPYNHVGNDFSVIGVRDDNAGILFEDGVVGGIFAGAGISPAGAYSLGGALNPWSAAHSKLLYLYGSTSGSLQVKTPAVVGTRTLVLPAQDIDFSALGGSGHVLRQTTVGGAIFSGKLPASDLSNGVTGSGKVVLDTGFDLVSGTFNGAAITDHYTTASLGQLPGTMSNDAASAGKIGQIVSSQVAIGSAVTLANGTPANVTSISLPAGDWDVWAVVMFGGTSTNTTALAASINATSATIDDSNPERTNYFPAQGSPFSYSYPTLPISPSRVSIAATTTMYLVARGGFSGGTCVAWGTLIARRRR